MTNAASARTPHRLTLAGAEVELDPAGVLWWPAERLLAVADLHLEKGASLAARGRLLPPYDTAATLAALGERIASLQPAIVVALGDSFHAPQAQDGLADDDRARLADLQTRRRWVWIAGNHDPASGVGLGGEALAQFRHGPLVFRHVPEPGSQPGEVAGHLHPAAKVPLGVRTVRRRCFATCGSRLVMPAFGAYAGGLNVCDRAFAPLFAAGFTAVVLGERRLYALPSSHLRGD